VSGARPSRLRVGSRGSRLALVQADWVCARLRERFPGTAVEVVVIHTKGDKLLDAPLAKLGDKGLFVKELENALLDERIDLAVHSAKDVPTEVPPGLTLAAFTRREDPRDVFVARPDGARPRSLAGLPPGARLGSSSLRRRSQLLALRPDLEVVDIRGNVETRLRKVAEQGLAGTVLAAAGLARLGRGDAASFVFDPDQLLPAVGQGALAVEARADDPLLPALRDALDDPATAACVRAERALLRRLEGGCQVPLAAHCVWGDDGPGAGDGRQGARREAGAEGRLFLRAYVGDLHGRRWLRAGKEGDAADPEGLGVALAEDLLARGGADILAQVRREHEQGV